MSRGGAKITRSDYYEVEPGDRIDWLDSFAKKFSENKTAVEAARGRNQSIFDQISYIVNDKPAFNSVESKVQELQERIGLKAYLKKSNEQNTSKLAQVNYTVFPHLNNDLKEKIITFVKNLVETHRGLVPIPAVQEEILNTFKLDGVQAQDINNPEVAKFISDLILELRKRNPSFEHNISEIGKGVGIQNTDDDGSNTDFFKGLLPANQG